MKKTRKNYEAGLTFQKIPIKTKVKAHEDWKRQRKVSRKAKQQQQEFAWR